VNLHKYLRESTLIIFTRIYTKKYLRESAQLETFTTNYIILIQLNLNKQYKTRGTVQDTSSLHIVKLHVISKVTEHYRI